MKYSPDAEEVIISTKAMGHNIEISVQDKGMGIPGDAKEKVFDRFFRVPGNKMHTYPGMGLGLYISAGIVQQHGGKMHVESEVAKGSTFSFTIPILNNPESMSFT